MSQKIFRQAQPEMTEEKKLRFLVRGEKLELFACLVHNPYKKVAEFASEVAVIEKTLDVRMRHCDRKANELVSENIGSEAVCSDILRETSRAVIKKELRKLFLTAEQRP